jgi:hypothetical protein
MGKLTNEFVEECLDRQDGDVPQLILAIAGGANPTDALLERMSRKEILDWLSEEFDGLLMHGFEPLLEDGGLERNNAEILLGYLEKTKAQTSPGLKFEVEPVGDPEELGAEGKYYEESDVTIRYEGVELGSCVLESEGQYVSGKWVSEPAQWPTLLPGLIPLPTVVIEEPQRESREVGRVGDDPSDERSTGGVRPAQGELFDVIKEYDQVVDRPEARKRLEQTNPALVAARDKAVTQLRRERVNHELVQKQGLQETRAVRRRQR